MNCNCIEEIETRIHAHFKDIDKEHAGVFTAEMEGQCLLFEGGLALSLPVVVGYKRLTKSGNLQKKTRKFNMLFKYCPYCGKLIEKQKD